MTGIEAMIRQIAIIPKNQSCLHFFWPTGQTIRQYQYTRFIFGARCSPATVIFVLQRTAQDFAPRLEIIELVSKCFYLNDFVHSFQNAEYAQLCLWSKIDSPEGWLQFNKICNQRAECFGNARI